MLPQLIIFLLWVVRSRVTCLLKSPNSLQEQYLYGKLGFDPGHAGNDGRNGGRMRAELNSLKERTQTLPQQAKLTGSTITSTRRTTLKRLGLALLGGAAVATAVGIPAVQAKVMPILRLMVWLIKRAWWYCYLVYPTQSAIPLGSP